MLFLEKSMLIGLMSMCIGCIYMFATVSYGGPRGYAALPYSLPFHMGWPRGYAAITYSLPSFVWVVVGLFYIYFYFEGRLG